MEPEAVNVAPCPHVAAELNVDGVGHWAMATEADIRTPNSETLESQCRKVIPFFIDMFVCD